jgi:outer membrane lipoprotein-sorting protein
MRQTHRTSLGWAAAFAAGALLIACGEDPPAPSSEPSGAKPPATAASGSSPVTSATAAAAPSGAPTAEPSAASPTAAPSATASATPTAKISPTGAASATAAVTGPPPEPLPTATTVNLPPPVAGTADATAASVDEIFADKTRFFAKFLQKHKQKVAGVEREMKGSVYVERPNKISFRYDPPNKNRIVSDGTTLRIYVAEDEQMFEHPVKKTEYPGAFSFIMGEGIRKSFELQFNEKAKYEHGPVLFGKPRVANPSYESVQFYVDKKKLEKKDPGAVTGVLILDAQGNRNRFELYDAKFLDKIDPNEFSFTPPAGTNIVK